MRLPVIACLEQVALLGAEFEQLTWKQGDHIAPTRNEPPIIHTEECHRDSFLVSTQTALCFLTVMTIQLLEVELVEAAILAQGDRFGKVKLDVGEVVEDIAQ